MFLVYDDFTAEEVEGFEGLFEVEGEGLGDGEVG